MSRLQGHSCLPLSQLDQLTSYLYQCGSAPWHGWYAGFYLHIGQRTWRPDTGPSGRFRAGQDHKHSQSGWLCTGPGSCAGCLPEALQQGFQQSSFLPPILCPCCSPCSELFPSSSLHRETLPTLGQAETLSLFCIPRVPSI